MDTKINVDIQLGESFLYEGERSYTRSKEMAIDLPNTSQQKESNGYVAEIQKKEEPLDPTNVFVKYLPSEIRDTELGRLFAPFGRIISAKVMLNHATCTSLGYGFVKFATEEEARLAVRKMSGFRIDHKILLCKLANPFVFTIPSSCLYIKPLPITCTEEILDEIFQKFGEIQAIKVVRDQHKPIDVVGLVRFSETQCASKALQETNGKILIPGWRAISVKYAETEGERTKRKANLSPRKNLPESPRQQPSPFWQAPNYAYVAPVPVQYRFMYVPVYYPMPQEQPLGWYNSYYNKVFPAYTSP